MLKSIYDPKTGGFKTVDMTPEEVAQIEKDRAEAAKPVVPQKVSMRQAKLALLAADKLATIEAAFDALPEPQRTAAKIEWTSATEVERDWPLVIQMTPIIGGEAAVDQLFIHAITL
jgi:hypothetical protein